MAINVASGFLLLFAFCFRVSFSGQVDSIQSVPDLQKLLYKDVEGYPCVRLLNLTGEIGCANPGRDKVSAPIVTYKDTKELAHSRVVLLSVDEINDFFSRISNDSSFAKNVAGVLVESGTGTRYKSKGFSPDKRFPQVEFAPSQSINYEWNPIGSGVMWEPYNFPVYLLSESSSLTVQEIVAKKDKRKDAYAADVMEFDMVMDTTKAGTRNSDSCLKGGTCLPIGGYSVLSSIPPINVSSTNQSNPKPILLALASMDSGSFFRDKNLGADSPISGLISLLAAVDALSQVDGLDNLSKQLVFLVLTGEAWGYLGSRRFLFELDLQSDAVVGLNGTLIETVLEIGSVGTSFSQGAKTFFAHKTAVTSATNEAMNALKQAQESIKSENIKLVSADTSNPGLPPSSLTAFLRKNPQTSGIVLEDFNTNFANKFYHSHLDDSSNINSSAIVAAASLVARTLYILAVASDSKDVSRSELTAINVNTSLVEELMSCLLECEPGLSCELVKNYILPTNACPSHYAGVVSGEPSSDPNIRNVDDTSRFVWNFLADRTSTPTEKATSNCSMQQGCTDGGEMCIKAENNEKGVCVVSTTRYIPAYSTRLKYKSDSGTWTVLPPNSSDPMGMVDPVWTESNWNSIRVRTYVVQDATYDRVGLLAGIMVTVFSYVTIAVTRSFITKVLKRD